MQPMTPNTDKLKGEALALLSIIKTEAVFRPFDDDDGEDDEGYFSKREKLETILNVLDTRMYEIGSGSFKTAFALPSYRLVVKYIDSEDDDEIGNYNEAPKCVSGWLMPILAHTSAVQIQELLDEDNSIECDECDECTLREFDFPDLHRGKNHLHDKQTQEPRIYDYGRPDQWIPESEEGETNLRMYTEKEREAA